MTTDEALKGTLDWAVEAIPALADKKYDHIPAAKPQGLPDIVSDLVGTRVLLDASEEFPMWQLQQRAAVAFEIDLSIMVDNSDPAAAAEQLRDYEQLLRADLLAQPNLRGHVPFRSPRCRSDFTPPFVEYEDGTKGREMTFTVTVGDLAEVSNG